MPTAASLRNDLVRLCGAERVSASVEDRIAYARDMWPLGQLGVRFDRPFREPALVVWPVSTDEVVRVVELARARGVPLIPIGAGSGVCGGTVSTGDSIALDLKRMDRILDVDASGLRVRTEVGIVGEVFERRLQAERLTLGHFPSSIYCSTVGGWLAARSAGQLSTAYGKIEDMVLDLVLVTGEGEVVRASELAPGGDPTDLAGLVLGTEGTAGVLTEVDLAVHPYPESREFLAVRFGSVEKGLEAIRELLQAGVVPAAVRLYDAIDTALVGKSDDSSKKGLSTRLLSGEGASRRLRRLLGMAGIANLLGPFLPKGCLLILTFEGAPDVARAGLEAARRLVLRAGGQDPESQAARHWWEHRYDVSYKQAPVYRLGGMVDTIEVAATWDRVVPLYRRMRAAIGRRALVLAHFSHAYREGCSIYFTFVIPMVSFEETRARYERIWRWAMEACLATGATSTHHHGVGLLKSRAFRQERAGCWPALVRLDHSFDPDGILNPGKLVKRPAGIDERKPR